MTTLRETILSHLKGTTGQAPVYLDDLRKKLAKICDDPNLLHSALDALYSEHQINRASGEKRGVKYMAYWSTGTVQTFPPGASYGRATQPPRRVAIRDTESKPINTAQPIAPTTKPETTMNQTITPATATHQSIVLDLLFPSPTNPRKRFDDAKLGELAESIKQQGILQPLLVREEISSKADAGKPAWPFPNALNTLPTPSGRFEIIAGERRYRAAKLAGLSDIPCFVRNLTDAQVLHAQVIENLQRDDLHPLEEAEGYDKMIKEHGSTAESLGAEIAETYLPKPHPDDAEDKLEALEQHIDKMTPKEHFIFIFDVLMVDSLQVNSWNRERQPTIMLEMSEVLGIDAAAIEKRLAAEDQAKAKAEEKATKAAAKKASTPKPAAQAQAEAESKPKAKTAAKSTKPKAKRKDAIAS